MTPTKAEFLARIQAEKERRAKERTSKRKAQGRVYSQYVAEQLRKKHL